MIELLCGMLGVVMALGVFALGFFVGQRFQKPASAEKPGPDEDEVERIRRERERMEKEQAAFRALVGYSADVAYGLTEFPKEGLE